jgi:hypothetical protein
MDYEVKVARSIEEVEALRSTWEKMQNHPNVDIDYYLTIVDSMADILRPHVILFSKNGQPEAMAVGRLMRINMSITLGYKNLLQIKVPCLTILYGGLLGNWSKEISCILINELIEALKRDEADIVLFNLLRSDSQIYELAKKKPRFICRDHVTETNPHWRMTLPSSLDGFLKKMSSKHRYWLNRLPRVLEKEYPGKVMYKCYRDRAHIEQLFTAAEEVARTTYQRQINAGFIDNKEMRRRLSLSADHGWLRAYLLYVNEKPCAFWIGTLYGKTFHLDFTGYDAAYKQYEPGTILFIRMIEDLSSNCIEEIDFGFGEASYKKRFGDHHWNESSVYIYAPTIKGVMINMIRTMNLIPYKYILRLADRIKILQKVKRLWRNKLINHSTGDIK